MKTFLGDLRLISLRKNYFPAMFLIIVSCLVSQDNVKRVDFSPNQPNALSKNVLTY